ncbi:hypothetical protein [Sorangium sp. So ce176]|uniref:hypothetical protein n=1 Tax=Sorangium sp. So ce176 TaxID=3133286 RepID=UPI003F5DE8B9
MYRPTNIGQNDGSPQAVSEVDGGSRHARSGFRKALALALQAARQSEPMPAYKYEASLRAIDGCPPPCSLPNGVAFRVVHNPIRPLDFEPKAAQPNDDDAVEEEPKTCGDWGLSMFTSLASIQKKWGKLIGKYPHLSNDVGDHVASGQLTPSHGGVTKPNKEHHFNLYEFHGADLPTVFTVVARINVIVPNAPGAYNATR